SGGRWCAPQTLRPVVSQCCRRRLSLPAVATFVPHTGIVPSRGTLSPVLKRFEYLIDPFPPDDAGAPPTRLIPFLLYYSRSALPWLVAMAVLTAALSIVEIFFVTFLGTLVDRLAAAAPETFLGEHAWELASMAAVILIVFTVLSFAQSLF